MWMQGPIRRRPLILSMRPSERCCLSIDCGEKRASYHGETSCRSLFRSNLTLTDPEEIEKKIFEAESR